jgi:hypothetical protein
MTLERKEMSSFGPFGWSVHRDPVRGTVFYAQFDSPFLFLSASLRLCV